MRDFYTTEEATKEAFLFVSYSHNDQEIVKEWVDFLIDQGVRVWWDKAFLGGDDWETIAQDLLSHENCSGILFFASENAIQSSNVAKEWRTAAKTKENRAEGVFYPQIIMIDNGNGIDYKFLTNYVKKTEELFSDDDYDDFRSLFGKKDHIYYVADKTTDKEALLYTIKKIAPHAMDEYGIIQDKLADISNSVKDTIFKLGTYGTGERPLLWRQISVSDNETTLLCQDVLTDDFGGQKATEWLESFTESAFSLDEQSALQGKIRLLTVNEAENISDEALSASKIWWLADCEGNLQSVVREDGTVYKGGYNNKLYQKGIRPVITLDSIELYSIVKNK